MTRLEEVRQEAGYYLDKIRDLFLPGAKATVLIRHSSHPNGDRDFVLTDDQLPFAIKALEQRLPPRPENKLMPSEPGFFWAKWRIADDGTAEADELTPSDKWEVVEVVENCVDRKHPEYLKVSVGGVVMSQSPENFVWGPEVLLPKHLRK